MKWYQYSSFFQMMGISASSLIPLFWKGELGYSAETIGFLNAISISMALCAPLFFGWIGTRKNLENIIKSCFILTALLSPLFLSTQLLWVQALLFTGISFFKVGFTTLVPVGVLNLLGDKAAQDYGRYRRIGSIGFLIGVIGAGYLINYSGPKSIFYILFFSALLAAYPYFNKLKIPQLSVNKTSYLELLKIRGMAYFYIATLLISTWSAAAFIFMPLRLSEMGASSSYIGWVVSLCGIVALFTLTQLGRVTDKFNPHKLYFIVPIFAFLRILFYGLPTENIYWFVAIQLLHIPSWVLGELIQVKTLRTCLPKEHFSRGMGLLQVSQSVGLALGSASLGWASGLFSLKTSFILVAPIPLIALIFIVLLNRKNNDIII